MEEGGGLSWGWGWGEGRSTVIQIMDPLFLQPANSPPLPRKEVHVPMGCVHRGGRVLLHGATPHDVPTPPMVLTLRSTMHQLLTFRALEEGCPGAQQLRRALVAARAGTVVRVQLRVAGLVPVPEAPSQTWGRGRAVEAREISS